MRTCSKLLHGMRLSTMLLGAALAGLTGCRPAPHLVERVEVVSASVVEAPLLGISASQLQANFQRRVAAESRLKLLPAGTRAPQGAAVVRLVLELSGVREVVRAGHEGPEVEVVADLTLRRRTESGSERTELWASGAARPRGETFEDRQDAARRALDQALDELIHGTRAQLDALDKPDKALVRDLDSPDPRVRDAALDVLAARKNPRSVPVLLERLQSDDALQVRRAMGALVEMHATQAVPALIDLARGKDPGFLRELVFALGAIGGDEARAYLYTVAQGHDSPGVREAAKRAMDELMQHSARAAEEMQGASAEMKRSPTR